MNNQKHFLALTTLWALVECGLGSILHALHLPFTGIILGGFSVVIISLIAYYHSNPAKKILEALLIVAAIKVAANPATGLLAYIALCFQGVLGILLYSIGKSSFIIHFLFATLSMLESAGQQVIKISIIGGKPLREAIDALGRTAAKSFGVQNASSLSYQLIAAYLLLFFIWGWVLALFIHKLPQALDARKDWYSHIQLDKDITPTAKASSRKLWLISFAILAMLLFIFWQMNLKEALYYILRLLLIIIIWQYVLTPLANYLVKKFSVRNSADLLAVQDALPSLQQSVVPLYKAVSAKYKGIARLREFAYALLVFGLHKK
jgi:hypothetical protein